MPESLKYRVNFEQLFKENYSRLYFYALNLVNDHEEAKDITSSVFEYVWDNHDSLDFSKPVAPFLFTLVKNKCIDYLRRKKTAERYVEYISMESANTDIRHEDALKERDEQIAVINAVLETLPAQTRKIVEKCFLEGKKYKEAAEEMNISINTVKTHIVKAYRILRSKLGG